MSRTERGNSPFPSSFVLFGTSRNLMIPIHIVEGGSSFLSLLNEMINISKTPLTDTCLNILPALWTSLSPVKLTHVFSSHLSETNHWLISHTVIS